MTIHVSPLATDIVRVSAGKIVSLPYHDRPAMRAATREAVACGLVECGYDEDQPTTFITDAGRAFLASCQARGE